MSGAGTGCVPCGSSKINNALEKEVKKPNLQEQVLVIATGCNGFCESGPILMVHPEGVFYRELKVEDIPQLWSWHLSDMMRKGLRMVGHKPSPGPKLTESWIFSYT